MKLDVNVLRYLSRDDWRVLTSVEMGEKNVRIMLDLYDSSFSPGCHTLDTSPLCVQHEIVPLPLIDSISGLK